MDPSDDVAERKGFRNSQSTMSIVSTGDGFSSDEEIDVENSKEYKQLMKQWAPRASIVLDDQQNVKKAASDGAVKGSSKQPHDSTDDDEVEFGVESAKSGRLFASKKDAMARFRRAAKKVKAVGRLFAGRFKHVEKNDVKVDGDAFRDQVERGDMPALAPSVSVPIYEETEEDRKQAEMMKKANNELRDRDLQDKLGLLDRELAPLEREPIANPKEAEVFYTMCIRSLNAASALASLEAEKGNAAAVIETCIDFVSRAFHVDDALKRETLELYQGVHKQRHALRKTVLEQLKLLENECKEGYRKDDFDSADDYQRWLAKEQTYLVGLAQKVNRAMAQEARKILQIAEKEQAEADAKSVSSKCCGFTLKAGVTEPEHMAMGRLRTRQESEELLKLAETPIKEAVHGSRDSTLNVAVAFSRTLQFLTQYELDKDGESKEVTKPLCVDASFYRHQLDDIKMLQFFDLAPLSDTSYQILRHFSNLFRVSPAVQHLEHLELLSYNQGSDQEYFQALSDAFEELRMYRGVDISDGKNVDVSKGTPLTKQEMTRLKRMVTVHFCWAFRCLSRYKGLFDTSSSPGKGALRECTALLWEEWHDVQELGLLPEVRKTLTSLSDDDVASIAGIASRAVTDSITVSYGELLETTQGFHRSKKTIKDFNLANYKLNKSPSEVSPVNALSKASVDHVLMMKITSIGQLRVVFESVRQSIDADEGCAPFFDIFERFSLSTKSANTYLSLVWSNASTFLRELAYDWDEEPLDDRGLPKFDGSVFKLYGDMQKFYTYISRIVPMESYRLQDWFDPFVDKWLEIRRQKFSEEYLALLIKAEQKDGWLPMSERAHYSFSVISIFKFLYPVATAFKKLPYSKTHITKFAQLITEVVQAYVLRLVSEIQKDLAKEDAKILGWGYAPDSSGNMRPSVGSAVVTKLNNLLVIKTQLFRLLKSVRLEDAYDHEPEILAVKRVETKARLQDIAKQQKTVVMDKAAKSAVDSDEDEADEDEVLMDLLDCADGFRSIRESTDLVTDCVAKGLMIFCAPQIHNAVWYKPVTTEIQDVQMQTLLDPMWNHLMAQLDHVTDKSDDQGEAKGDFNTRAAVESVTQANKVIKCFLYDEVLWQILGHLLKRVFLCYEKQIVHPYKQKWKLNLSKAQILRVQYGCELMQEFLIAEYALPPAYIKTIQTHLNRVIYLYKVLLDRDSTQMLTKAFEIQQELTAGEDKDLTKEQKEQARISLPPYLDRDQILGILRFRGEFEKDDKAKAFVKKNTNVFSRLFS